MSKGEQVLKVLKVLKVLRVKETTSD